MMYHWTTVGAAAGVDGSSSRGVDEIYSLTKVARPIAAPLPMESPRAVASGPFHMKLNIICGDAVTQVGTCIYVHGKRLVGGDAEDDI